MLFMLLTNVQIELLNILILMSSSNKQDEFGIYVEDNSNVPLSSHKSPTLCLICYSIIFLLKQHIVKQLFTLYHKENPPSVLYACTG